MNQVGNLRRTMLLLGMTSALGVPGHSDCHADSCPSCTSAHLAGDYYCPNCHGADYDCLHSQIHPQHALGKKGAFAATHNDFGATNSGYCRMQHPHSPGRTATLGPKLLTMAKVAMGVGISQAQFNGSSSGTDGSVACGMCIEVSARMPVWDCELNNVSGRGEPSTWPQQKLLAMVMDRCEDGWELWDGSNAMGNCVSGHLDFDVYPTDHDLSGLQIHNATWRAVDCPTDELTIQYVFATPEVSTFKFFFSVHLWDLRVPAARVEVLATCDQGTGEQRFVPLLYSSNGFGFHAGAAGCDEVVHGCDAASDCLLTFRLTSVLGEVMVDEVHVPPHLHYTDAGDQWVAFPAAVSRKQFEGRHPASRDANACYEHCRKGSSGASGVRPGGWSGGVGAC